MIGAGLGLFAADQFVPGVKVEIFPESSFFGIDLMQSWHIFLILGIILGLLNFFVKPLLNAITLPLRVITLGLFSLVINMGLIWAIDVIFEEFSAPLIYPLLFSTLIVFGANLLVSILFSRDKN